MPVQYGEPASVEYVGPEQVPVALECAYCGKVIVVDLLRWNGECFRCSASATIDEIATALALIPPAPQVMQDPGRAVDPIMMPGYYGVTGSVGAYSGLELPHAGGVPAPPPKPPMLGYYKGIPMDEEHRAEIEKESGESMEWLAARAEVGLNRYNGEHVWG